MTRARQHFAGKMNRSLKSAVGDTKTTGNIISDQIGYFGNTRIGHFKFLHFGGALRKAKVSKTHLEEGDIQ